MSIIKVLHEKEIFFKFKGNRDYVHGTDIFDKILENVSGFFKDYPTTIKGSFHRLLKDNGILRIYNDSEEINHENLYALFSIRIKSHSYQVTIIKANSQIPSSYEYDERQVLDKMVIENDIARMVVKSAYTYIEQIVAMTKKLHLTFYPDARKKWLFTKIEIKDAIDPALYPGHELAIKAVRNFHNKLTQNTILLDDQSLGNIWFSEAL